MGNKIAITGANGFVGRALCQHFQSHHINHLPLCRPQSQNQPANSLELDYNDSAETTAALENCSVLVHLIAKTHSKENTDNLPEYLQVNKELSEKIALCAKDAGIKRIVYLSSIKVNGEQTESHAYSHLSPPSPSSAYGSSKLEAEKALQAICNTHGVELVIIRPPLIFATHAKGNIASLRRAMENGIPLPLNSIKNNRSVVELNDLCELISRCCHTPQAAGETFLAATETLSTPDLARKLAAQLDCKTRLIPFPLLVLKIIARLSGKQALFDKLCHNLEVDDSHTQAVLGPYHKGGLKG